MGWPVKREDDGPGMPESVAQHVFEPFFSTKAEGGHGNSACPSARGL